MHTHPSSCLKRTSDTTETGFTGETKDSSGTQQVPCLVKSSIPAQSVECSTIGFGEIIEEQLQLEGMRRCFPENTETYHIKAIRD